MLKFKLPSRQIGRRLSLAMLVSSLLFVIYLVTYNGTPITDDERFIIDTTDSIAVRGTLLLNETGYIRELQRTDVEPAQPLFSVPLYWLAYHTPWIGNVQILFLFAPIVTALAAFIFFYYVTDLGYDDKTALAAVLILGLATVVWPYTKTYFREPLTMLMLLSAAFLLNRWRMRFQHQRRIQPGYLIGGILVIILALFSKEATLIALPVLVLITLPRIESINHYRREFLITGLIILAVVIVLLALILIVPNIADAWSTRFRFGFRFMDFLEGIVEAKAWQGLAGYLFSPGKSIWWYSPILLLCFSAPILLPAKRWRESWLMLALMIVFVFVYAAVRGKHWQGGTGWGPRYMVPLTPFLMIAALPAVDQALNHKRLWPKLMIGALSGAGFVINMAGVYANIHSYHEHLIAATGQPPFGHLAIWSVRWSQAIGTILSLGQVATDIRWLFASGPPDWVALIVLATSALVLGFGFAWTYRRRKKSVSLLIPAGGLLLAVMTAFFVLWRAYDDPRYLAGHPALRDLRVYLAENASEDDVILLSSPAYVPYFANYYKGTVDWFSMPAAPGERFSVDQDPQVISDDLGQLLLDGNRTPITVFSYYGEFYRGGMQWLVYDLSAQLPWSTRPVEWYANKYNFRVQSIDFEERLRLVQYLPLRAPDSINKLGNHINVNFGSSIQLNGYNMMTDGRVEDFEHLEPGDTLGVSLGWQASEPVDGDYTVAVYFVGPDGVPVLQHDAMPVGNFEPTNTWEPGEVVIDNYGFILPENLAPGTYQVWVVMYDWQTGERLPAYNEAGDRYWEDIVALATIEVR